MESNIAIEDLLSNFASRSGLEDIASFADVFRVSLRQGANIQKIIASTRDVINDKIEICSKSLQASRNESSVFFPVA